MTGLIIGIIVAAIMFYVAKSKKGSTDMKKPDKTSSFVTDVSIDKSMKAIINYAQSSNYIVDDFDENKKIIILSSKSTAMNYGFIFPVYLTNAGSKTNIEIGVKAKSGPRASGPLFNKDFDHLFNGIKTAIYAVS